LHSEFLNIKRSFVNLASAFELRHSLPVALASSVSADDSERLLMRPWCVNMMRTFIWHHSSSAAEKGIAAEF